MLQSSPASTFIRKRIGCCLAFLGFAFVECQVHGQWGAVPTMPKHENLETNQKLVELILVCAEETREIREVEARAKYLARLAYALVALKEPDAVEQVLHQYPEIPKAKRVHYYSSAARQFAKRGDDERAWAVVETMANEKLFPNSVYSIEGTVHLVIREIAKEDPDLALTQLLEKVSNAGEAFEWRENDTGFRSATWQAIVKSMGKRGDWNKAEELVKKYFDGVNTHDHLFWDLAVSIATSHRDFETACKLVEKIESKKIAHDVMLRLGNKCQTFEEYQFVFQTGVRMNGAAKALNYCNSYGWLHKSEAAKVGKAMGQAWGELQDRSGASRQPVLAFELMLFGGMPEEAFQFMTGNGLTIDNEVFYESVFAITSRFAREGNHEQFLPIVELVQPGEYRSLLVCRFIGQLVEHGFLKEANRLVDLYEDEYSRLSYGQRAMATASLLRLDRIDVLLEYLETSNEANLEKAHNDWHKAADYFFAREGNLVAMEYLEKLVGFRKFELAALTLAKYGLIEEAAEQVSFHHSRHVANPVRVKSTTEVERDVILKLVELGLARYALQFAEARDAALVAPGWISGGEQIAGRVQERINYPARNDPRAGETEPVDEARMLVAAIPDDPDVLALLARAYARNGQLEEYLETLAQLPVVLIHNHETYMNICRFPLVGLESYSDLLNELRVLAEDKGMDPDGIIGGILDYRVGDLLEKHQDATALGLPFLAQNINVKVSVLCALAWGVNSRRQGHKINF